VAGKIAAMTNEHKGRTGIDRIVHATRNSLNGLHAAYTGESAFRQETWLALVLLPASLWLGRSAIEVAVLVATVLLVLIVELLNSAIEAVVDRVSFDWHDLSKRAKDIASAAVFLSLLLCAGVWAMVIAQRFVLT
jgi:diacylglycerol kinase (ATP)